MRKMSGPARILLVEDTVSLAQLYLAYLQDEPVEVAHMTTGSEALGWLEHHHADLLLLDLQLPDMDGMSILRKLHVEKPDIDVVVITAHGGIDVAVEAIRTGAFDYIEKPFDARRLKETLKNALKARNRNNHNQMADDAFHGFIGSSQAMKSVYQTIESVAPSRATVFITGESGTGKEVCAQAIHRASPRADMPFIALNCAAIPKNLMESEIFGHKKGAFTGATSERKGAAALADGGTLFLDELCEMDLDLQTKLLRFIQTGTFQPVGSGRTRNVDVRFICATNRDPLAEVQAGRFREDLYYRLHVIPIHLPPLRERGSDVLLLAERWLKQYGKEEGKQFDGFTGEASAILLQYHWPGNVRQLQNVIRNIVVLNPGGRVGAGVLPVPLNKPMVTVPLASLQSSQAQMCVESSSSNLAEAVMVKPAVIQPLWKTERQAIEQAIEYCDGNITKAAGLLEVSPSTIYRKLQHWQNKSA